MIETMEQMSKKIVKMVGDVQRISDAEKTTPKWKEILTVCNLKKKLVGRLRN